MATFFAELKRRKVIRVLVAYVVASWLLLQVADVLSSVLELPDWAPKLVFFLLVIGVVPAVILAWAYDITPEGIKLDESDQQARATAPTGKSSFLPVASVGFVAAVLGAALFWLAGADERWIRDEGIPEVERQIAAGDMQGAFAAAMAVEEREPGSKALEGYWREFSWKINIPSQPEGAAVYRRDYNGTESEWQPLGVTPLYDVRVPRGLSVFRFELEGYEPVIRLVGGLAGSSDRIDVDDDVVHNDYISHIVEVNFQTVGAGDADQLRVPGYRLRINDEPLEMADFFIDRFEVTNQQFQAFVSADGYRRPEYWEHDFIRDGQPVSWDEAMAAFVDSTGQPGPSTWVGGAYPEGQGNYPVGGISWYEAAAYARFAKRELPTVHHWRRAHAPAALSWEILRSNVETASPAPVGQYRGIGWVGTLDMVGNVREWCANSVGQLKATMGGGWSEAAYLIEPSISNPAALPAFDRSPENGVRLARLNDERDARQALSGSIKQRQQRETFEAASDEAFAAILRNFEYSQAAFNASVEESVEIRGFTRQQISFDFGEGDDRMLLHLYLPDDGGGRHPVVFYWASAHAFYLTDIDNFRLHLDFMLKRGWAVALPVFEHTFERGSGRPPTWSAVEHRNQYARWMREMRRSLDYLETRADLDMEKLVFYGFSWGGRMGALALAIEPRFKVGILNQAGFGGFRHYDIVEEHYLPRVTQPVLQFNGRFDSDFRLEESATPFFELLGSESKKQVVGETGHFVPMKTVIGETLAWVDAHIEQ